MKNYKIFKLYTCLSESMLDTECTQMHIGATILEEGGGGRG